MSGKKKYTEKTLAEVANYFVSIGTIVNWKKNKSKIISSIF
jgi:hypothetical protein